MLPFALRDGATTSSYLCEDLLCYTDDNEDEFEINEKVKTDRGIKDYSAPTHTHLSTCRGAETSRLLAFAATRIAPLYPFT